LANLDFMLSDQTVGNIIRRHGRSLSPTRKQVISWKDFIRSHMGVLVGTCLTARPMDKCRLSRKCNANCRKRRQECGKRQQMKEKVVCENLPQLADFVRLATPLARFGKVDRTATNQKAGSSNPPGRTISINKNAGFCDATGQGYMSHDFGITSGSPRTPVRVDCHFTCPWRIDSVPSFERNAAAGIYKWF
jgi:hypothetical protein